MLKYYLRFYYEGSVIVDSLIFDLDGTLWDTTYTLIEPWNETLKKYNIQRSLTREDLAAIMGMTVPQIAAYFMPETEETKRIKIAYEGCDAEIPYLKKYGGKLFPKVEETLKILSESYKLFIVSNCEEEYIKAFFEAHGLKKYFTDEEYIGRTGLKKSENIKLIINRNSLVSPVYVGDTAMDEKACRDAGVDFIFAEYGFGKAEKYIAKIENFYGLPELCKKI